MSGTKRPVRRGAFFLVDGQPYADLLFNHGEPLVVAASHLQQLLDEIGTDQIVVGRRLDARERALLSTLREDAEAEAFAHIFPDRRNRWGAAASDLLGDLD